MVSAIVPSYKDPLLHKTVASLLENARGQIEIIIVLDGYYTAPINDPRVHVLHLGKNGGMRNAINAGVRVARGEYLMRTDEHCMFAPGFDTELTKTFEPNWIVTPRRYFLDPVKWERMDLPYVDYEKLKVQDGYKFFGQPWHSRKQERQDIPIDETMAMQGSCWIMKRSWWDNVIGELQTEGYGPLIQDSHEMVFKTWKAGGKLMVNKNTWFSHKHVSFPRTHSFSSVEAEKNARYAYSVWGDYYQREIKPKWKI